MVSKLISVNVGLPREVVWKGKQVRTGIFKEPVHGRLPLRRLDLDGDGQADLTVHGGADKAVYVYPAEHYEYWRGELPDMQLGWGMFGENFTTEGFVETAVQIGDRFRIGSAEVIVTQPRMPCYKLGLKFGRDDMVKRFMKSRLTGFYFAVLQEGEVGVDDVFEPVPTTPSGMTVADITGLYVSKEGDADLLKRAVQLEALPESWRTYFQERLDKASV